MSSGRNRDYRKLYRGNLSRNAWQPYAPRRPQFMLQRSRRSEEEDDQHTETRLIDSALKVCNARVEFELSPQSSVVKHDKYEGKAKVIILRTYGLNETSHVVRTPSRNASDVPVKSLPSTGLQVNGIQKVEHLKVTADEDPDGPPVPKVSLFPESRIILGWKKPFPVGAGMCNLGNTCYLNATLQALFYIPSFCNWLMSEFDHDENSACKELDDNGEKCIMCAMSTTLKIVRGKPGSVIKPYLIYNRLKSICKHLSYGRQEDAHEFLRYLMEKMEQSYLERFKGKQLENASKETTPVHRIFGGYMRSEICCLDCKGTSTTFQHFQDLMLDIRRASSLDDALQLFFSRESLEGDDGVGGEGGGAYKCGKCHIKGHCVKRNSIQIPPKVLCIQLKRFTAMGGKLVKHISYPEKLDMSSYLHSKHPGQCNVSPSSQHHAPLIYHLTSIVSHCGTSMNSGHYTATAKSPGGDFYEFDDTFVHQVPLHGALEASAYILMYEMFPVREEITSSYPPLKSTSSMFTSNGSLSMPTEKLRTFVMPNNRSKILYGPSPRPMNGSVASMPSFSSTASSNSHSTSSNATVLPPVKEREKVFFDIKSSNQTTSSGYISNSPSSHLNGTCISKCHLDLTHTTPKKLSPEPKSQSPMVRTSPKVNGVIGSPTKTNKSQPQVNASWSSSSAKPMKQPSKFPYSLNCNQVHSVGTADGSGREGPEKSLDRLSKLGLLVGVSGKGREGECLSGKVDHHHLVSYPVLSGESSDEEEERRCKRSRKCSEGASSKHLNSASEMTISGNLTADATAIAASRGWNITGNTVTKGNRDFQKTVDNRVSEAPHLRKELPNGDRVEVSLLSGRERTERNGSVSGGKSEIKKLSVPENGEKCESSTVHSVGERLEERPNGTSQPSSPCLSTSSTSSDYCCPVLDGTTAIKSILKIIDRSNCSLMEDAESKEMAESTSKLKALRNGTGSVVVSEGDAQNCINGSRSKLLNHPELCHLEDHTSSLNAFSMQNSSLLETINLLQAVAEGMSVNHKVKKWLSENDFEACENDRSSFCSSILFDCCDKLENNGDSSRKRHHGATRKNKRSRNVRNEASKVKCRANKLSKLKDMFAKAGSYDSFFCSSGSDCEPEVRLKFGRKSKRELHSSSSGSIASNKAELSVVKVQNCQPNRLVHVKSDGSMTSASITTVLGKVPQRSGASPVPVLGRSDARSLISNPS